MAKKSAKKGGKKNTPATKTAAPAEDVNGVDESTEEAPKALKRESTKNGVNQEPANKKRKTTQAAAEGIDPPKLRQRPKQLRERPQKEATNPQAIKKSQPKAKKSPIKKKANKKPVDYEVEKIIDVREKKGKREYLVRWKGYAAEDDSWEPEKNLNCPSLLEEFNEKKEEEPVDEK